jgi:hypothetical protein
MLRDKTERAIVRDAAIRCGLSPVEISEPDPGLLYRSSQGSQPFGTGLRRDEQRWLPLIVADEESSLPGWQSVIHGKSVWSSAVMMVRERRRAERATRPDSSYAGVLERPLLPISVEMHIDQAVRANRVFLGRYQEMTESPFRSRSVFDLGVAHSAA